jgi:hypothetical protein
MNDRVRCTLNKQDTEHELARSRDSKRSPELDRPYLKWADMNEFIKNHRTVWTEDHLLGESATPKETYTAEELRPVVRKWVTEQDRLMAFDSVSYCEDFHKPIIQSEPIQLTDKLWAIRTRWWCKENPSSAVWFFQKTKTSWKEVPYNKRVREILEMNLATQVLTGGQE